MREIDSADSDVGVVMGFTGTSKSIIRGFLGQAAHWRGPLARLIKAELKRRLK